MKRVYKKFALFSVIYTAIYIGSQVLLPILFAFGVEMNIWQLFIPTFVMIGPFVILLVYLWLTKTINEIMEDLFRE